LELRCTKRTLLLPSTQGFSVLHENLEKRVICAG
jgi:hypothetical protein